MIKYNAKWYNDLIWIEVQVWLFLVWYFSVRGPFNERTKFEPEKLKFKFYFGQDCVMFEMSCCTILHEYLGR